MRRATIALAIVLVAAACSSDGGAADETTTTVVSGGATSSTEAPSASTSTTSTTGAPQGSGGGAECLVGTWNLDAEAFFEAITASMSAAELQGASFAHVGGVYQAVIEADGTFIDRRVDWNFAVTSPAGELEVIINHERTGSWRIDDGIIDVSLPGDVPAEQQVFIDGEEFEFPGGVLPFSPPAVDWIPAAYDCDGDTLNITAEGVTSMWTRTG